MTIELRKIRIHDDMSEETTCFSAEVWIDGVKFGNVRNDGHGGCHRYWPRNLETMLDDGAVDDLLDLTIASRDLKKAIKSGRIVVMRNGSIFQTGRLSPDRVAMTLADPDRAIREMKVDAILNLMPHDEALRLYMAGTLKLKGGDA